MDLAMQEVSTSEKLQQIRDRIRAAVERGGHGQRNITIVGASKDQSVNAIRTMAEFGIIHMGENYAQELLTKAPLCMETGIRWHFIGHLQSNKAKHILPYVSSIDSVDSVELAKRIGRLVEQSETRHEPMPIMIQVNHGHERQKSGLPPQVVESLFSEMVEVEGVKVIGLMTIPPAHKDKEKMRPFFKETRLLHRKLRDIHPEPEIFSQLSMGMSSCFETALEEGSTCIRLGELLFGPRPKKK